MSRLCSGKGEYQPPLGATSSLVGGNPTMGPDAWSPSQLRRFLKEPLIAGLLDQVGKEHPKDPSCSGRKVPALY